MKFVMLLLALTTACYKANPAVCCVTEAACAAADLDGIRGCSDGLACVENQCTVPSCATTGCAADAPNCNIETDVCEGCDGASDCERFASARVCDTANGACVECVTSADCDSAKPVCDADACRGCSLDSECASGACGDDGTCVPEDAAVYLSPTGVDNGLCARNAPCRDVEIGVMRTSSARKHIVMAPGIYVASGPYIQLSPENTPADSVVIHGGGATLKSENSEPLIFVRVPAAIRDLEIEVPGGDAIIASAPTTLERIKIRAYSGIQVSGPLIARDLSIHSTSGPGVRLRSGANLELDRAEIHGGAIGIVGESGSFVKITNLLVYATTQQAINLPQTAGTIAFSTIADTGANTASGPRAFVCSPNLAVRSCIIWDSNSSATLGGGCTLSSTIVGAVAVPGASNTDPEFVDRSNSDYRLRANSPAKDMVDTGPATDFEGDARPRGPRFDVGADEAP